MNKLSKIFLGIIFFLIFIIVILLIVNSKENNSSKYDVSTMNEVSVSDIVAMFESDDTFVLFVGRKSCEVCVDIIPALKEAQLKNNYITQYLDIEKVDRSSEQWAQVVNRLTMKSTQTLTEDGSGEEITETYGYFLHNYGFTPTIVVIKEGKQIAGSIGGSEHDILVEWLTNKVN